MQFLLVFQSTYRFSHKDFGLCSQIKIRPQRTIVRLRIIVNPHANFFQRTFSRIDVAHDFISNYLPKNIVNQLDLNTLELDRESFVDILLSATQSDLVFKVKRKDGKKLLIYVLIEHKSFIDKWVLFQVLGYIVRINEREREIKQIERKKKLMKIKQIIVLKMKVLKKNVLLLFCL